MNILNRFREYQARRKYEKQVLFRERFTPYGIMYGQVLAHRRRAGPHLQLQERAGSAERLKAKVRAAFMSHPAATEADFERCWPELRNEIFKQYTLKALGLTQVGEAD